MILNINRIQQNTKKYYYFKVENKTKFVTKHLASRKPK